ncbi:MAG: tRNA pseudouridine(38-40) synthase TruA [Methanomicrobiaceae archaeon]|nr:tRNA pseudouridine(38-40) synthase TruA [Methanomicrobiaceae archaeon]
MKRLGFLVSYFGDHFFGSQMQPDRRTVEGEFIAACRSLNLFDDWREAGFAFSGRTDRGVHARRQMAAFTTDEPERAISTLNFLLPADCWCAGWAPVPETFHPRYNARQRTYRYFFPDPDPDIAAMQAVADVFVGTHDFSRFARVADRNPRRTILSSRVSAAGSCAVYEVTGESFLWNMVRCMATALTAAGKGEMTPEDVEKRLSDPRGAHFGPAPAGGLVLWDIDCGIRFQPIETDRRSGGYCRSFCREWRVRKKVVESLCRPGVDLGGEKPVDEELWNVI